MARWRLTAKHYLTVPGIEWEQKETNRDTGRQMTKKYPVPLFLDPDDPADQNYREAGEISSCLSDSEAVMVIFHWMRAEKRRHKNP